MLAEETKKRETNKQTKMKQLEWCFNDLVIFDKLLGAIISHFGKNLPGYNKVFISF